MPAEQLELRGLTLSYQDIDSESAEFDLALDCTEKGAAIHCLLEYNADIFAASTARTLLTDCEKLLTVVVHDPEACIGDIPLVRSRRGRGLVADTGQAFSFEVTEGR